jgi:hypothetical protein
MSLYVKRKRSNNIFVGVVPIIYTRHLYIEGLLSMDTKIIKGPFIRVNKQKALGDRE